MTSEQSKQLKVGDHVFYHGDETDHGRIIATQLRYVTIKWNDGHQSFTGHNEMGRVERFRGRMKA